MMKKPRSNIADSLFGETRQAVLALLFSNTGRSFYLREIVRAIGKGMGAIQRELASLAASGIVKRERKGNQVHYGANVECPVFQELKGLITKTVGVVGIVRDALKDLENRIDFAFIYGSFARGEDIAESDVDIMVIGDVTLREIGPALSALHEALGREINPVSYPLNEFVEKLSAGHHFLSSVAREPKIFLIGKEDEFRKLGEERLAGEASD